MNKLQTGVAMAFLTLGSASAGVPKGLQIDDKKLDSPLVTTPQDWTIEGDECKETDSPDYKSVSCVRGGGFNPDLARKVREAALCVMTSDKFPRHEEKKDPKTGITSRHVIFEVDGNEYTVVVDNLNENTNPPKANGFDGDGMFINRTPAGGPKETYYDHMLDGQLDGFTAGKEFGNFNPGISYDASGKFFPIKVCAPSGTSPCRPGNEAYYNKWHAKYRQAVDVILNFCSPPQKGKEDAKKLVC